MHIPTGWVEIDQICMIQLVQILYTIATDHLNM